MSNIFFRGQNAYPHGSHMCTTASMHVAVASLCKRLDLLHSSDTSQVLRNRVDSIMHAASQSHAEMERKHDDGGGGARMLSVHDIIRERKLNLSKLGILYEEIVVVSSTTSLPAQHHRKAAQQKMEEDCFIQARQLPARLVARLPCAATVTGNGHTVCIIHYAQGRFALFDSLPGLLAFEMDGTLLLKRIGASLGLQFWLEEEEEQKQHQASSSLVEYMYRKGRKVFCAAAAAAADDDGERIPKRPRNDTAMMGSRHEQQQQQHQCDVTMFWRR